jgi:uncharacterized protein (DUF2062 family)
MTQQPVRHFDTGPTTAPVAEGERVRVTRVLGDQRKVLWVALVLVVADFWILLQVGEPTLAACTAGGIALGLGNHLVTEYWLLRLIASGEQPTRKRLAAATLARLTVLSVVAVGIAASFWPDGIGLLLGLAIFRLVALLMTSITLLKELKNP